MKHLGYQQLEVRVMTVKDALHQLKLEISENENRKDFSFSEKLKEEYGKIAELNSTSGKHLPEGIGRVRDKVAADIDIGSGEQYRKAEYIYQNADEEMIKQLDEGKLDFVIEWMVDTQLGRRNLTPIQKIAIAEKYRPTLQKLAKEKQGQRNDLNILPIMAKSNDKPIHVRNELAKIAGVSNGTYSQGK